MKMRLGIIVNPIAGIGGKAGLKGSDNPELIRKAISQGFEPESPRKAIKTLMEISALVPMDKIEIFTGPKEMGENEVKLSGLNPKVIGEIEEQTTPADTEIIAKQMLNADINLLLFFGGDGTARNIYNAVGANTNAVVLGIPAGVKMHSAVFATNLRAGAELAASFLKNPHSLIKEMEVMDIDEEAFRNGFVSARLYGYLKVPYHEDLLQGLKVRQKESENQSLNGIANDIVEKIQTQSDYLFIIGPGTTTREIMIRLNLSYTLLGVDVVQNGKLIGVDVNESQLLELIAGRKAKIVVTPIGGQGFVFGRGNQQISAKVIGQIGKNNILIVAPMSKILSLQSHPMRVDTGENGVDLMLRGYTRVINGYKSEIAYLIS